MTDEYDADHETPPILDDQSGDGYDDAPYAGGGRRRASRRRGLPGCIAVLVALAVVAGGAYLSLIHI